MKKIFYVLIGLFSASFFYFLSAVDCYTTSSKNCFEKQAYSLPSSVDEFLKLREKIGKEPYGGAALFLYALMVRTYDPQLGNQLLVLSIAEENLKKVASGGTYKGYSLSQTYLLQQADKVPHCIRSYGSNTKTENNYKIDPRSVGFRFRRQEKYAGSIESGTYKVFVCSTGTDSCRPITLQRNPKGYWKVKEFSSIVVGCKKPKDEALNKAADDL